MRENENIIFGESFFTFCDCGFKIVKDEKYDFGICWKFQLRNWEKKVKKYICKFNKLRKSAQTISLLRRNTPATIYYHKIETPVISITMITINDWTKVKK